MKESLIILSLIFISFYTSAQHGPRHEQKEKMEALRVGFLTEKLDLTSEEAQKFWPVYNEYRTKLDNLRKTRKAEFKDAAGHIDELSDKEVEAVVDNEMIFRQKELDIIKDYHSKFKSVLTIKKVARLYRAEEMFKRELIRKLQEKGK